jgi:hypothetical protein
MDMDEDMEYEPEGLNFEVCSLCRPSLGVYLISLSVEAGTYAGG